jgi:hypothetical protein
VLAEAVRVFRAAAGEWSDETQNARRFLATARERAGDVDAARTEWLAVAHAEEVMRVRASTMGTSRKWLAYSLASRVLACDAARRGDPVAAWRWVEASGGRDILDDVTWRSRVELSEEDRHAERAGEARCRAADEAAGILRGKSPRTAEDDAALATLQQEQSDAWLELKSLQTRLASRHGSASGELFDLPRVQAQLGPDTALVEWVHTIAGARWTPRPQCWACVVRSTGKPRLVPMRGRQSDGQWSLDDHRAIGKQLELLAQGADAPDLADLRRQLVEPLLPHLDDVAHVIVTGAGPLAKFPVELLFADRVGYAPSATLYAWFRERPPVTAARAQASLLAVANPRLYTAPPLPNSAREVAAISKLFSRAEVFVGSDADEAHVQRLLAGVAPAPFTHVHIGSHGVFAGDGNAPPHILLSEPPPRTLAELIASGQDAHDGRIDAHQVVQTWRLRADLVTISACRSGTGRADHIDFAQALLTAGARSVVLSLWEVNDFATTLLMVRFYENLLGSGGRTHGDAAARAPMAKVQALHEAKLWLRSLTTQQYRDLAARLDLQEDTAALRDWKSRVKPTDATGPTYRHRSTVRAPRILGRVRADRRPAVRWSPLGRRVLERGSEVWFQAIAIDRSGFCPVHVCHGCGEASLLIVALQRPA